MHIHAAMRDPYADNKRDCALCVHIKYDYYECAGNGTVFTFAPTTTTTRNRARSSLSYCPPPQSRNNRPTDTDRPVRVQRAMGE